MATSNFKHTLLLIGFLLCSAALRGQQARLYSSQQGLPNTRINRVYQDPGGTIWVASRNGLSYFDGMHFTTFRRSGDPAGGLKNDLVTAIFTDSRGTCWTGTSEGVQIFDPEYHTFTDFAIGPPDRTHYISSIGETPDGKRIVIATSGARFRVFDADTHQPDSLYTNRLNELIRGEFSGKTLIDSHGIMWMYSENGLCRIDPERGEADSRLWGAARERVPAGISVSVVREEPRSGLVLIGTFNHGVFIYDPALGYVRPPRGGVSRYRVRDILAMERPGPSGRQEVWIGTEESGIRRFDPDTERITEVDIRRSPVDPDRGKIHTLMQDRQGNVWAGIFQTGLLVIPRSVYGFEYNAFTADGEPRGENLACVTSVVRDRSGTLWVGTDGAGLFRLDEGGRTRRFTRENTGELHNNSIMNLTLDGQGKLWIATYMGGITTWAPQEGFRRFSSHPDLQKAVHSAYDGDTGTIWYGTHGSGVVRVSVADGRVERFAGGIPGYVNSVVLDSQERLWVTSAGGLTCFDIATQRADTTRTIGRHDLNSIHRGRDGVLWIGSPDGLVRYDPETNESTRYTREHGLPDNMIYSIEEDSDGVLWIGTGFGLSRFDPREGVFRNFYAYDGLQDNEFQNDASNIDSDGKLFFGGIGGLTSFYPDGVAEWEEPLSDIRFSKLTVAGRNVDYREQTGRHRILDRPIDQARRIVLNQSQNNFSIEFSVLEYTNPQKVRYSYLMEGFDSGWRRAEGTQRSVTYTNLPDGNYRFHIKAVFDGDIDEDGAASNVIEIRILPPWYKTWWAWLVYAAMAATTVWLFIRFLRRRRLRHEEQLAMERKDLRLQMFTDLSHEIRTPLTLVMTPLKAMWEGESDGKRRGIYNLMYRNARRILTIINQLIDMNRIGTPQFRMRFYRTDMIAFLNDIVSAFEHQAVVRNIDCRTMSPRESLDVWIDQCHFDKVVFNILSNAFKFTPDDGTVLISLETYLNSRQSGISVDVPRYLEIRFENSGSRIPPGDMEHIFERFGQADGSRSAGSGIGLHLAKRIVELHYGTIEAENTETGVAFVLRIPLGEAHLSAEQKAETTGGNDTYGIISPERDGDLDRLAAEAGEHQHPATDEGSLRTIYFVDDDTDLLKYIHLELSDEYRIETFPDGEKAWEAILAGAPDAVVTDLAMPLGDGAALCRRIRENRKTDHLPIIVLTAETAEESECRCLENGADRYLTKPVGLELLKWTIAQAIGVRETLRSKYSTEAGEGDTDGDAAGDGGSDTGASTPDSRFVAKVIESIRRNIEDPELSVEQLSAEIGISRVHLGRKLKENLDMSPSMLIRSIRLRHGAYLLVRHNLYVSEVADRVGFSSPSSFSNSFRDYFGMSPTEYAAKNADNEEMTTGFDISS